MNDGVLVMWGLLQQVAHEHWRLDAARIAFIKAVAHAGAPLDTRTTVGRVVHRVSVSLLLLLLGAEFFGLDVAFSLGLAMRKRKRIALADSLELGSFLLLYTSQHHP
jgi:hypothetical protein